MRTPPDENPSRRLTTDEPVSGAAPERRCILTGAHGPRAELIRLAVGPDNVLWPDLGARLPGRGAWITADRAVLTDAIARGKLKGPLARSFRTSPPQIPEDLPEKIAAGLQRRALDRLGLELRAGHLIFGAEKITDWARAGRLFMLLHACDAAPDGVAKLNQAYRSGGGSMQTVAILPAGRLSLSAALGRANMVHSGVTDGRAAARIATDVTRWSAYTHDAKITEGDGAQAAVPYEEGRE